MASNYEFDYSIFMILIIWQFIIGIRSIVFHQIKDYSNDKMFYDTWIVNIGVKKGKQLIKTYLLPFEIIMLIGSLIVISKYFILIIPFSVIFWILIIFKYKYIYKDYMMLDYKHVTYTFLDDYYQQCFPILILIFMIIANYHYVLLLLIHILLFKNIIINYLNDMKIILLK